MSQAVRCKWLFGSLVLAWFWFWHSLFLFCLLSPCSRKAKKQSKVVPGRPCCVACCVASCVACCVAWRCVALRGALRCVAWLLCAVRWFVALLKADFVFLNDFRSILRPRGVQNVAKMAPKWLPGGLWAALGAPTLIFGCFWTHFGTHFGSQKHPK